MKGRIILLGWLAIVILLAVLTSCNICKYCQTNQTNNSTEKDSVGKQLYPIPQDSVSLLLKQLIECRNGKPVMNPVYVLDSKGNELSAKVDSLGYLLANFRKKADTVYVWIPIIWHSKNQNSVVVKETNHLTAFQKFCVKWFWGSVVLILLGSVSFFYRSQIKLLLNKLR